KISEQRLIRKSLFSIKVKKDPAIVRFFRHGSLIYFHCKRLTTMERRIHVKRLKKPMQLVLSFIIVIAALAGCGGNSGSSQNSPAATPSEVTSPSPQAPDAQTSSPVEVQEAKITWWTGWATEA